MVLRARTKLRLVVGLALALACGAEGVDANTPASYGDCGASRLECFVSEDVASGCHTYYEVFDGLTNEPVDPWWAVCARECSNDGDCPIPRTGDIAPSCGDHRSCELACEGGGRCPDGMECVEATGVCMWLR
ncbi:MAG: hypothetical protein KC636_07860 [Myxococcales bacterium]|nr:hypothetical protein [Myxococcales bacterium]